MAKEFPLHAGPRLVELLRSKLRTPVLAEFEGPKDRPIPVVADRAYDSDAFRAELRSQGLELCCPHRRGRKRKATQDGRKLSDTVIDGSSKEPSDGSATSADSSSGMNVTAFSIKVSFTSPASLSASGGFETTCKKKYGQLITQNGPYQAGFFDYTTPNQENCKVFTVIGKTCEELHNCLVDTLKSIDNCCIQYNPVPLPGASDRDPLMCNSNCVAQWLVTKCDKSRSLRLVPGPKIRPGQGSALPDCLS